MDRRSRRRRAAREHHGTAGLRRDEGQGARRGAREALRRGCRSGPRSLAPDAGRRRLAAGARRLPGGQARAQGRVAEGPRGRLDADSPELDRRAVAKRVGDLGDLVHALSEVPELLGARVAVELDVVLDGGRDRRLAGEVAAHRDADTLQVDPSGARLAKEVVRYAPCNREVEQLATVEADPTATAVLG